MSWAIAGRYVRAAATDPDAQAYLQAVEAADGQALEFEVARAIDNFVLGCKADGIWNAIKASCILAGARTLAGALVPLVGAAPTNFNFVPGDYNRKTGLVGDESTKYLDTNRNASTADLQNNHHAAVFPTLLTQELNKPLIAARASGTLNGSIQIINTGADLVTGNKIQFLSASSGTTALQNRAINKLTGLSRSSSSAFLSRSDGITQTNTPQTSTALANENYIVLGRTIGGNGELFSSSRLAFYSIGESLDLALLDTRVTDLINAFAAAIP